MNNVSAEVELDTLTFTAPCSPALVLIIITPLLAELPYKAAAFGPFKIVMEAISSGLIVDNKSPPSLAAPDINSVACSLMPLDIGTPSKTING